MTRMELPHAAAAGACAPTRGARPEPRCPCAAARPRARLPTPSALHPCAPAPALPATQRVRQLGAELDKQAQRAQRAEAAADAAERGAQALGAQAERVLRFQVRLLAGLLCRGRAGQRCQPAMSPPLAAAALPR